MYPNQIKQMQDAGVQELVNDRRYSMICDDNPDKNQFPLWYTCEKHEVILNEGEKLFIPAGWFHFVFSEGEGVNFAVNFWYETVYSEGQDDRNFIKTTHDLKIEPKDIFGDEKIKFYKSKTNLFPPTQLLHRYPKGMVDFYSMTFDEFEQTKNKSFYSVQNTVKNFEHLAEPHPDGNKLKTVNTWLNFGGKTRSLPHYDMEDNWLCQIKGRKRIIMIPQKERDKIYLRNHLSLHTTSFIFNMFQTKDVQPYVYIKQMLTPYECELLLKKNTTEITQFDLMFSHLQKMLLTEGVEFIKAFRSANLVVAPPDDIVKFTIETVEKSKMDVIDIDDSMYTALWALKETEIKIADKHYFLQPGAFIIFPTQLTYTWTCSPKSVIMYPVYKDLSDE